MKIAEFKVGQEAYTFHGPLYKKEKHRIETVRVSKIGKKYVTATYGRIEMKFESTSESRKYLVENTEYGDRRLLFQSMEGVKEHLERERLKTWLREATGWDKIDNYTIEQLRDVKKVLNGGL